MTLNHFTTQAAYDAPRGDLNRFTTSSDDITHSFTSFILNAQIELSSSTFKDYRFKLNAFIRYCLEAGITRVKDITTDHIRGFIFHLQQFNSPKSVNGYYKVVSRFFSWLVDEDRLIDNPMVKVKPPRVPQKLVKVFTPEQIQKILLLCEDGTRTGIRNKAMILTLLDNGIRLSELARIQVEDIDIQRGVITVMGKGASEREVQLLLGHSTPRMTQHYTATITSQNVVDRHKDFSPVTKLNLKKRCPSGCSGGAIKFNDRSYSVFVNKLFNVFSIWPTLYGLVITALNPYFSYLDVIGSVE
jgi:integrase/recombinase XerC/integrase/recombinase XerD